MDMFESVKRQARLIARVNAAACPTPTWAIPSTSDTSRQVYAPVSTLDTWTPTYTPTWTPTPHVDESRPTRPARYDWMPGRLTWTPGHARMQRWTVRAYLDIVNRERVALLDAIEAADKRYLDAKRGGRVAAAYARAGIVQPTRDGAWDEWSQPEVINARETRAAERGRGHVKRAPSAARVTSRDAHGDPWALRNLTTVGHATLPGVTRYGMDAMDAILTRPMLATYRVLHTAPWGVDIHGAYPGHAKWGEYVPRVAPVDAPTWGAILPVHVDEDTPTSDTPTSGVTPTSDVQRYAAILGVADPTAAQG